MAFFITSESRRQSGWLDDSVAKASSIIGHVQPNELDYENGYHQSWGNDWWSDFQAAVNKIEIPNVRHGSIVLSHTQKRREITPVLPVFADEASFRIGKSALYMTRQQQAILDRELRADNAVVVGKVKPQNDLPSYVVEDSRELSIDKNEHGVTQAPYDFLICKGEKGKPTSRVVRLSPFILLNALQQIEDPSLVLLHEMRHHQQYRYDINATLSTNNQEIDAYIFTSCVIGSAVLSERFPKDDALRLLGSEDFRIGKTIRAIVGNQNVHTIDSDTAKRLGMAFPPSNRKK